MVANSNKINSLIPQETLFPVSTMAGEWGFFIQFEKTSPEYGWIKLDNRKIISYDLLLFLKYEGPGEWYISYFKKDMLRENNNENLD